MSTLIAEPAARADSAPNSDTARQKAWRAEIHTPEAEYNANVPVDAIERDPANRVPGEADVAARAASIAALGLLQPVVLRALGGGKYRLMAGETRWRAMQKLGRQTIAARIYKDQSEVDAATKALAENVQRADLTPIDRARRFRQLVELGKTQKEIGQIAGGASQPVVANALRLLELPADVQELVNRGELSEAHGVALVRFAKWPATCMAIAKRAIEERSTAKDIGQRNVPFSYHLVRAGLIVEIATQNGKYHFPPRPDYVVPAELQKDPDFMQEGRDWLCFRPAKWAPHKAKQDAEFAARVKKGEIREGGRQGKMSPTEKAARQKKIAVNKQARGEAGRAQQVLFEQLRDMKDLDAVALALVAQKAFGYHYRIDRCVKPAADAIELTLPKGFSPDHLSWLGKLKPVDLLRLCAGAILLDECECSAKFAHGITAELAHVLGEKKTKKIRDEVATKLAAIAAAKKGGAR